MTAHAHRDDDDIRQDFPPLDTPEAKAAGALYRPVERRVGDEYMYAWESEGYGIGFSFLRRDKHEVHGMITVVDNDVHPVTGKPNTYYWGSFNLTSIKTRHDLALQLAKRTDLKDAATWENMLTFACRRAYDGFREGQPEIDVAEYTPQPIQWAIKNLLLRGESNVFFGPGGGLKSFCMDLAAVAIACGRRIGDFEPEVEGPALLVDYETSENEVASRCQRIARAAGLTIPKGGIVYRQYWQSFAEEAHVTRALVDRYKCVFVGVDSIAYAVDGQVVPQFVMPFFNVLRSFGSGVTKVVISHVTKAAAEDPNAPATEFGSAFVRNSARASWEVVRSTPDQAGNIPLALYNRKINQGELQKTIFMTARFDGPSGPVHFTPSSQDAAPELMSKAAMIERLRWALQHGPLTEKEIAEATGMKESQVKGELIRQRNRIVVPIRDGRDREAWALLDRAHGETPPPPADDDRQDDDDFGSYEGQWGTDEDVAF